MPLVASDRSYAMAPAADHHVPDFSAAVIQLLIARVRPRGIGGRQDVMLAVAQSELVAPAGGPLERVMSFGRHQDGAAGPQQPGIGQLLARIGHGRDRGAFSELFRHFAPRLKGFFRKRGLNDAEAEELIQEIMLTVWRRADSYDSQKAAASTWLYAIARNRWIDRHRRENRPEIDPDDPVLQGDPDPAPDDTVAAAQRDRLVRDAMTTLPKEQLQLIHLSFYEDKPHSEIAALLDLPLGTVKSRIRLAMGRLRKQLGEEA